MFNNAIDGPQHLGTNTLINRPLVYLILTYLLPEELSRSFYKCSPWDCIYNSLVSLYLEWDTHTFQFK